MARSKLARTTKKRGAIFTSTATLAAWRLRRMWGMLFITGLGMIAAVMLVCAVPLYSQVAPTTGLRDVLTANRDSATLAVNATVVAVSSQSVADIHNTIETSLNNASLSSYLNGSPQFVIQTQGLFITAPKLPNPTDTLAISGYSMKEVPKHTKLIRGRLPSSLSNNLEVALTPETALGFHVDVGSTIIVPFQISVGHGDTTITHLETPNLRLHVVGIYTADVANDVFWHCDDVNLVVTPSRPPTLNGTVLVSSDTFLATLDALDTVDNAVYAPGLTNLNWYCNCPGPPLRGVVKTGKLRI